VTRTALIRADASVVIGTGHIYRCMTLAYALQAVGWRTAFLCRPFHGNLIARLENNGFEVIVLPDDPSLLNDPIDSWPAKAVRQDIQFCQTIIDKRQPNLVIVDHYAFDSVWETAVIPAAARAMVISDLYTTSHAADILLNQNLGASINAYAGMVPDHCRLLMGPQFALLRPEFVALRSTALARRVNSIDSKLGLLISLGGVDIDNGTGWILRQMLSRGLNRDWIIRVVLGSAAPHLADVAALVQSIGTDVVLDVDTNQMGDLMVAADVAIGAAGATAWERCCLGLPTIAMALAENQQAGATALQSSRAALILDIGNGEALASTLQSLQSTKTRLELSAAAATLCDGEGAVRVCDAITHLFQTG